MIPAEACDLERFKGWRCILNEHTNSPCALVPKWWNVAEKWRYRKNLNP